MMPSLPGSATADSCPELACLPNYSGLHFHAHACGWVAVLQASLQRIESDLLGKVPLSYFLGTLGMPGMTVRPASTAMQSLHITEYMAGSIRMHGPYDVPESILCHHDG